MADTLTRFGILHFEFYIKLLFVLAFDHSESVIMSVVVIAKTTGELLGTYAHIAGCPSVEIGLPLQICLIMS